MPTRSISSDIIAILRKFDVASEDSSPRSVHEVKQYKPRQQSTLIGFTYERSLYFILFDNSGDDSAEHIQAQIDLDEANLNGALLKNPNESKHQYGIPYKGKDVYLFKVESGKTRLDVELARRYSDLSRSTIQKYVKAGYVIVNGDVKKQPKQEVTAHDEIALTPPKKETFDGQELPIIYIDDNVIVVNKPAGILTHSKGVMNDEFTVAEFFRRYTTFGLETNRPGIVHRLDRDTSGVMIGARNDETALLLKKQFADRKTKKEYVAVVEGTPKTHKALIDLPIGRNPSAPSTFRVDPSGKPAQTTYEVLAFNDKQSLVALWPRTGRTHQLRVHTTYINSPIVGDRVYGTGKKAERLYLHAKSLEITIPISERKVFIAPTPKEFLTHFPEAKRD